MADIVEVSTNLGTFVVTLDATKAPKTVANFLEYVDGKHYDGTVFHRIIPTFMIQGGGFDKTLAKKSVRAAIENEADNGLKNVRGTIAMARTSDPHSATAQFFVNVADNASLDHQAKVGPGWGYTVFGKVTEGMETVDKIKAVQTGPSRDGQFQKDCPLDPVVINSIKRR